MKENEVKKNVVNVVKKNVMEKSDRVVKKNSLKKKVVQ